MKDEHLPIFSEVKTCKTQLSINILSFCLFSTSFQRTSTCFHLNFQRATTSFFSWKPRGKGVGFNHFSTKLSTFQHVIFHVIPPFMTTFSTCYHVISRGFVWRESPPWSCSIPLAVWYRHFIIHRLSRMVPEQFWTSLRVRTSSDRVRTRWAGVHVIHFS